MLISIAVLNYEQIGHIVPNDSFVYSALTEGQAGVVTSIVEFRDQCLWILSLQYLIC